LAKIYRENGKSGKNLDCPKMEELLKDVKSKKVNMIIIYKLDRLCRFVVDTYTVL
jgi:site-specific DNA recombinase